MYATFVTMLPGSLRQPNLMFALRITYWVVPSQWNLMLVLKWWWRLWIIYQVFYTTMVCDDDSTLQANCKWSCKDLQLQNPLFECPKSNNGAKKTNHGLLPLHVENCWSFYQNPPHPVFAGWFYYTPVFFLDVFRSKMWCQINKSQLANCLQLIMYYGGCFINSEKSRQNIFRFLCSITDANPPLI